MPKLSRIFPILALAAATFAFAAATNLHSSDGTASTALHVTPFDELRNTPPAVAA